MHPMSMTLEEACERAREATPEDRRERVHISVWHNGVGWCASISDGGGGIVGGPRPTPSEAVEDAIVHQRLFYS